MPRGPAGPGSGLTCVTKWSVSHRYLVIAVLIAGFFMIAAAESVSRFVSRHPTVKVLALSFLLLIGMSLVADGMGQHIPKGYIYFAMGFSIFVEFLNQKAVHKVPPVQLRPSLRRLPVVPDDGPPGDVQG